MSNEGYCIPLNNLRNKELEFTLTDGTQHERVFKESIVLLEQTMNVFDKYMQQLDGSSNL